LEHQIALIDKSVTSGRGEKDQHKEKHMAVCLGLSGNPSKETFDISSWITLDDAIRVVQLLNALDEEKTKTAIRILFSAFIWKNIRNPKRREFINIKFINDAWIAQKRRENRLRDVIDGIDDIPTIHTFPQFTEGEKMSPRGVKRADGMVDIDSIDTAAVSEYGKTLWIHGDNIMNRRYDAVESHFERIPIDSWNVRHYTMVILHEFGHIIRLRGRNSTSIPLIRTNDTLYDCYMEHRQEISDRLRKERFKSSDWVTRASVDLEEWFADVFAMSFIWYVTQKGTVRMPLL
jgi:hypothetical protein